MSKQRVGLSRLFPAPGPSAGTEDVLDAENKRMAEGLAGKVTRLKAVSARCAAVEAGRSIRYPVVPGVQAVATTEAPCVSWP